jgi:hypothetical protein
LSLRDLFDTIQKPKLAESDPFIQDGDTVLANGNSKSKDLPPVKRKYGHKQFDPIVKGIHQNHLELEAHGDPELGAGKSKKRKKKISHKDRALKYLRSLGWSTEWVQVWRVNPDGYGYHQDFRGLWDVRCSMAGQPELRVNVCGDKADRQNHLRKFCSDKLIKRFREDLEDPKVTCALLGFEKVAKGKRYEYEPVLQILTIRDLEGVLSRRRKAA